MRVYLPYQDFRRSAKCLSDAHLKEQRNSCRNLILAITVPGSHFDGGDTSHVALWQNYGNGLLYLTEATLEERRRRGVDERGVTPWMLYDRAGQPRPPWLGDPAFHRSHQSDLLRADPAHYGRYHWSVPHAS